MELKVRELFAGYGSRPILKGLSFDIPCGHKVCIVGENGCGKTTLLRVLSGILPYEGSITIDGIEISQMKREKAASYVAMLPQFSDTFFTYSVYDTVMMGRYIYIPSAFRSPSENDRNLVDKAISDFGLEDISGKELSHLSGGQKQRVFLARTIAQDTPIILLDEPMNHLDIKYQIRLTDILNGWTDHRHTLIAVIHDIRFVMGFADLVVVIKDGILLDVLPPGEALRKGLLDRAFDVDILSYLEPDTL